MRVLCWGRIRFRSWSSGGVRREGGRLRPRRSERERRASSSAPLQTLLQLEASWRVRLSAESARLSSIQHERRQGAHSLRSGISSPVDSQCAFKAETSRSTILGPIPSSVIASSGWTKVTGFFLSELAA